MAEAIIISGNTRQEKYDSLLPQLKSLAEERDVYAALGNIISALKYGMNFFWVGLYIVKLKEKREKGKVESNSIVNIPDRTTQPGAQHSELVLGPFQGTVACTRIAYGKGVCGNAWKNKKTIIVDDVNTFEGYIACSSESKSEIVLPVFGENGDVVMVLDIDSDQFADFNSIDELWLSKAVRLIESIVNSAT